ncbi:regulator of chromosome condensation 1/beta-lactamase-inhibitor protein II, partial [Scenedesmus sp. NREL 46B-D3]
MDPAPADPHALPNKPRAVKTRPAIAEQQGEHETEYAVSPNTPLLSTEVQENAWVCGDNGRGQLGVPGTAAILHPQPIQVVGRWAAVGISESHAAGLSCEGQLYTWGANQRGQLGLGDKSPGVVDTPVAVQTLSDLDVKSVACGLEHTVCITTKDVIAWGSNEYGQLGHGDNAPEACNHPCAIKVLHDVMVTQVTCGRFHTICVTAQSQVFAWGHNSAGQLGLTDRRDRHTPTLVDALWALPVVQLAAGDAHSSALTSSGHMFIWGSNHFGQLGLVRDGDPLSMRVHRKKKRVKQMYLMAMLEMGIPKHKAEVALTETGNVGVEVATEWLFSAPESAQFEHYASDTGSPSSTSSACSVEEPCVLAPKRVPLKGVRCIAAGAAHTLAVTDDACYTWG